MRDAPDTRHSLLARLHGNDSDVAWVEFVKLYEPAIYRFARRQGLQDADAHEVVQEVLLSVRTLASNPSNARREKFRAWLSTVTRNRIIDLVRKIARKEKATAHPPTLDEIRRSATCSAQKLLDLVTSELRFPVEQP